MLHFCRDYFLGCIKFHHGLLNLCSLSDEPSHRRISLSLEFAISFVKMIVSLSNLAGVSAVLLPRNLSIHTSKPMYRYFDISRDLARWVLIAEWIASSDLCQSCWLNFYVNSKKANYGWQEPFKHILRFCRPGWTHASYRIFCGVKLFFLEHKEDI